MSKRTYLQVTIKLGREWWLVPTKKDFTEKDIEKYKDVPYIGLAEEGKSYRFFNVRTNIHAIWLLDNIKRAHESGLRPMMRKGSLVWKPVNK